MPYPQRLPWCDPSVIAQGKMSPTAHDAGRPPHGRSLATPSQKRVARRLRVKSHSRLPTKVEVAQTTTKLTTARCPSSEDDITTHKRGPVRLGQKSTRSVTSRDESDELELSFELLFQSDGDDDEWVDVEHVPTLATESASLNIT
jgi:hypothetical protein